MNKTNLNAGQSIPVHATPTNYVLLNPSIENNDAALTTETEYKPRRSFWLMTLALVVFYTFLSTVLFGATIYIDPSYSGSNQNGSSSNPYNSWTKFTINSGNTYLQKSGTTYYSNSCISINGKSNVTLGTYGGTTKAKISTTGSGNHIINVSSSSNVTIKDLQITSTGTWVSSVIIQGSNASNNQVNNCEITKTEWGIRILTTSGGNKVLNSKVHDIKDDGIYIKDASTIEIGFCTIYDVNKKYLINTNESYSAGDGIQIASTNNMNFNIHDNIIDHSSMGNKFCIIAWGNNYSGIIERNTIIGGINQNTSGIYLSPTTKTVTVRYNMIKSAEHGIYAYAKTDAYYNVFANNKNGIYINSGYSGTIRNNVFYNNVSNGVYTTSNTSVTLRNNIFNIGSSAKAIRTGGSISSNNNVFNSQQSGFINNATSLTNWRNSSGNDMNSTVGNPSFVNPSNQDFHLISGSCAINRGTSVSLVKDYYGNSVPINGAPDAGVHEFGGTKSGSIVMNDSIAEALSKDLLVYPNPSIDGHFSVKLGQLYERTDLEVFDMAGRLVKRQTERMTAEAKLDMSTMPDGGYLIRVDNGVEKKTLKAIKNTL
ncbi:MAG TPA: right-handed parallel beta-helix repeat-containing protein [Lentimicrobium sp.]|nr:right-handed parallel beta-helix repeat-containing protein [Lentimicrobium sp.]